MNDARTPLAIENESSDGNEIKNVTSFTADNISVCYYLEEKVRDLNTVINFESFLFFLKFKLIFYFIL